MKKRVRFIIGYLALAVICLLISSFILPAPSYPICDDTPMAFRDSDTQTVGISCDPVMSPWHTVFNFLVILFLVLAAIATIALIVRSISYKNSKKISSKDKLSN